MEQPLNRLSPKPAATAAAVGPADARETVFQGVEVGDQAGEGVTG